jgi:alpha-L-rhamnosidase
MDIDPAVPGFKSIIIKPHPGGEMNNVSASHDSPYGKVSSAWEIKDGKFILKVDVPVNTTASVYVPSTGKTLEMNNMPVPVLDPISKEGLDYDYVEVKVGSGQYTFVSPYNP